jgi:hypothetical protein
MIAITFTTVEKILTGYKYIGMGEDEPLFDDVIVKHRINYSSNDDDLERCKEYLKKDWDYDNYQIHIIDSSQEAWDNLLTL